MPGTTPGIFLYIIFGTTASSRQKVVKLIVPKRWHESSRKGSRQCCFCFRRNGPGGTAPSRDSLATSQGGITVHRSLTITSANRASRMYDEEALSDAEEISMNNMPLRSASVMSMRQPELSPLPLAPRPPTSKFQMMGRYASSRPPLDMTTHASGSSLAVEEKTSMYSGTLSRTDSGESFGPEHSDDSGPILPIQRHHEVRFSRGVVDATRGVNRVGRQSENFSRPRR